MVHGHPLAVRWTTSYSADRLRVSRSTVGLVSPESWVSKIGRPAARSSTSLGWEYLAAYRFDDLRCYDLALPPAGWHFLAAHLMRPCTVAARWSGRPLRGRSVPGNAMLMSAGQDSSWDCSNAMDELHFFLNPIVLLEVAEEAGLNSVTLLDGVGIVSPALQAIASQLLTELDTPELGTRLFADTLSRALALELIRHHSTSRALSLQRSGMNARQLRAATDYIDSHIDEDLSLKSIAQAAAMSPFRFARGFHQAVGQSPRQYVILRRIERAKELLRGTERDLVEIAQLVGFSTQSHFTAMFRRRCGITPKRYRDALRA